MWSELNIRGCTGRAGRSTAVLSPTGVTGAVVGSQAVFLLGFLGLILTSSFSFTFLIQFIRIAAFCRSTLHDTEAKDP